MAKINRQELQDGFSFKAVKTLSVVMDKYFLDPILGFLFPSAGDLLTAVFSVPHFYISAVKIKSLPLTLAVLLNVLVDSLVGMIPFWIGDIIDVFNRSYMKNARLIVGFVEGNQEVIREVNRKAVWTGVLILLVLGLIYLMILLLVWLWGVLGSAWDWLLSLFA